MTIVILPGPQPGGVHPLALAAATTGAVHGAFARVGLRAAWPALAQASGARA